MLLLKNSEFAVLKGTFKNHFLRCCKPATFMMAAMVLVFTLILWNCQRAKEKTGQAPETRLSPKRLFSLLDLNTPGMEKVREAVQADSYTSAEEELMKYLRNRDNVNTSSLWSDRVKREAGYASKEDMTIADEALKHRFGGHPGDHERLSHGHQFGKDIDWKYNPIEDREWIWHFNMMPFWKSLARAYKHTGDEKYAREFFRQIDGWVVTNPPDGNHTTWRRIDAGIRTAGPWPYTYFHFLDAPSLTPSTNTRILLSLYEHAVYLHSSAFTRANHGLFEARGLFFISVLFPEFKDAEAWRENARGHLTDQILKQVSVNGGHQEICPYYHIDCLDIFLTAYDLARMNNLTFPAAFTKRLEKMYEFFMLTSLPDGTAPRIGDSWHLPVEGILAEGAERFNRKDLEYVATAGASGIVPNRTSVCFEPCGYCVMRDGWDEKSQYLLLKWKYGGWHSHFDDLSIILASGGRILLDDSSTEDYHGGGRPKSRATVSHSTIAINGQDRPSELRQTKLNQWLQGMDIDYVDASGPVTSNGHTHRRRIAYIRDKYWVMIDDVRGNKKDTDQVDMYFQFAPGKVQIDGFTARTDFKEGDNLMVKVMEIPGLTAQQEEGWIAVEYKVVKPRPRVQFSVKKVPMKLTSLLYPYEGDVPDITMEKLTLSEDVEEKGVFGLSIRINGREDLIFFAPRQYEFTYQDTKLSGPVACIQG
jgi:heparan-sulfate lyase